MKALKYGIGVLLVGGFALTASCGGSSGDSSSPSGGTGGTSTATGGKGGTGTTTGGTGTGTGGTITATGGTGTGTGGTGTAGTGATTGGTGGATVNDPTCPPATPTPMMGDTCTLPPAGMPRPNCVYGATTCTCRRMGGGMGAAGAPPATEGTLRCAATPPPPPPCVDGGACTGFGCQLPNNGGFCRCMNNVYTCAAAMGAAGAGG
jgi:hypothetical protein